MGLLQCLEVRAACAQTADDSTAVESRASARRVAEEAAIAYENEQYEQARDLFHRANELYPAPALMLWEARSLDKLGRLVEAEDLCVTAQRYKLRPDDTDVARAAIRDAAGESEMLRKRIPTITVQLLGIDPKSSSAEVQLNGKRLHPALIGFPVPIDAGERTIVLLVNGIEQRRQTLTLAEGERTTVELNAKTTATPTGTMRRSIAPAAPNSASGVTDSTQVSRSQRPFYAEPAVGWFALTLGAIGLTTGIVGGVIANRRHDALEDRCSGNACPATSSNDLNAFRRYRTFSTIGYAIGGVGLATGLTVLLIAPRLAARPSTPSVSLQMTAQSIAFTGSF